MLKSFHTIGVVEAGLDEAGRGCLAGPVYAAAVILPAQYRNDILNDSKQLNKKQRDALRPEIEENAVAWAVASVSNTEIDEINILNASILAMHRALDMLKTDPDLLLIDGNRFKAYKDIKHVCVVKGDATYYSIAAASVLAKTHRDAFMEDIHLQYPGYNWISNKGYPTRDHKDAINKYGITPWHRISFNLNVQLSLEL